MEKIAELILLKRQKLALAETTDTGKPISESFDGDILRSAQNFQFFGQFARAFSEEAYTTSENERHIAVREPVGVCGLITPLEFASLSGYLENRPGSDDGQLYCAQTG